MTDYNEYEDDDYNEKEEDDNEKEDGDRKRSKRRSLKSRRSFTVTGVTNSKGTAKNEKNLGGRFISTNPASAAKKAGTQICSSTKKEKCVLIITVQETTQNSNKKEYTYKYRRIHDPKTVVREGVEITFNYKTECKALK